MNRLYGGWPDRHANEDSEESLGSHVDQIQGAVKFIKPLKSLKSSSSLSLSVTLTEEPIQQMFLVMMSVNTKFSSRT